MKIKPNNINSDSLTHNSQSESNNLKKGISLKRLTVFFGILITLVVILFTFLFYSKKDDTTTTTVTSSQSQVKSETSSVIQSSTDVVESNNSSKKSKEQEDLENKVKVTHDAAPDDIKSEVISALSVAQDEAISKKMDLKPSVESHLSLTHSSMVDTFSMAINVNNYRYDTIEVFTHKDSNNPKDNHTYQFIATFKSQGKSDWFISGYYIDGQIRLTEYSGGEIGATFG